MVRMKEPNWSFSGPLCLWLCVIDATDHQNRDYFFVCRYHRDHNRPSAVAALVLWISIWSVGSIFEVGFGIVFGTHAVLHAWRFLFACPHGLWIMDFVTVSQAAG